MCMSIDRTKDLLWPTKMERGTLIANRVSKLGKVTLSSPELGEVLRLKRWSDGNSFVHPRDVKAFA